MHVHKKLAEKTAVCFESNYSTLFPIQGQWEGGTELNVDIGNMATGSGQGCEFFDLYTILFINIFPFLVVGFHQLCKFIYSELSNCI